MGRMACAECSQNCKLVHGKKGGVPSVVASFFKVMFGKNFSEILFLPPKFARQVSNLTDQKVQIEDVSRQRWTVTLSKVDGFLAFQKGWDRFSLDHNLEVGDLLVFELTEGSQFLVQVYGRSGCEKLNFSMGNCNQRKRAKTNENSVAENGQSHTTDSGSSNKLSSSTVVSNPVMEMDGSQALIPVNDSNADDGNLTHQHASKTNYSEEPFYMLNRDAECGEDRRSSLFDLSSFEMQRISTGSGIQGISRADERFSHHGSGMRKPQANTDIMVKDVLVQDAGMSRPGVCNLALLGKDGNSQMAQKVMPVSKRGSATDGNCGHISDTHYMIPVLGTTFDAKSFLKTKDWSKMHSSNDQALSNFQKGDSPLGVGCQNWKKLSGISKFQGSRFSAQTPDNKSGKDPKMEEECDPRFDLAIVARDDFKKLVKCEPGGFSEASHLDSDNITFPVLTEGRSILELPRGLPCVPVRGRLRPRSKVILLRGPESQLWPVLYHDRLEFKVLGSGWEAFVGAKKIQAGDECIFKLENESECIYRCRVT